MDRLQATIASVIAATSGGLVLPESMKGAQPGAVFRVDPSGAVEPVQPRYPGEGNRAARRTAAAERRRGR